MLFTGSSVFKKYQMKIRMSFYANQFGDSVTAMMRPAQFTGTADVFTSQFHMLSVTGK